MTGLMICDDLMFTSKVSATARAHGLSVVAVRSAAQAIEKAKVSSLACVIVDLHTIGVDLPAFMSELRATGSTRVVAYGSHVNKELLQQARDAGCDVVLPRSQFAAGLETQLAEWMRAE